MVTVIFFSLKENNDSKIIMSLPPSLPPLPVSPVDTEKVMYSQCYTNFLPTLLLSPNLITRTMSRGERQDWHKTS